MAQPIYPLPANSNKDIARRHASEIARLLQSKVLSHSRIIVEEPHCPFRIPCHQGDFWFKVLVSDNAYVFTGEHRRQHAFRAGFAVAFKHPWINLGATHYAKGLSAALGFDVFQSALPNQDNSVDVLLTTPIRDLIRQTDLSEVRICFLNSTQIHVSAKLHDPSYCVQQVGIYRALMLTVFHALHVTPTTQSTS